MSKKQTNKYLVPVELTEQQRFSFIKVKSYEYKLFADSSEQKFTRIRFIDINGFIIGEHMPTKLQTVYDKAAMQVKNTTVKAVSEIKNVVEDVADSAVGVASGMKEDASKTAKQTVGMAVGLFGKIKTLAKDKLSKSEATDETNSQ